MKLLLILSLYFIAQVGFIPATPSDSRVAPPVDQIVEHVDIEDSDQEKRRQEMQEKEEESMKSNYQKNKAIHEKKHTH